MNRTTAAAITFLVAVLLGLTVLPLPVQGAGTGFFTVLVLDAQTQNPIENAMVWIDDEVVWNTLKDGRCTFRDVTFGTHTITVLKDDYRPVSQKVDFQKNATEYQFSLVKAKEMTQGIIKGRVFLDVYAPPYDAGEAVVGFETPIGSALPGLVDVHATTDPLIGEYYTLVDPGDHFLWCWAYGHVPVHSGAITVLAGGVTYYDFHLKYTGMHNSGLAGNVTDASDGSLIAGATVIATDGTTTIVTTTDSNGFYFFIGPNAGTYTLIAASSSYEPGTASGTVSWGQITYVDIQLKKGEGNRTILWGFVYGDGVPLSTATVFTDVPHTVNSNVLGIAGLYAIMDFPGDEDHLVGAMASGYYPVSTMVNVPTGTIYRQDLYMQKGKERYAVVIASVWEKTTGNAVANATIMLNNPGVFSDTQNTGPTSNVHVWVGIPVWGIYSTNCVKAGYTFVEYSISTGSGVHPPSATFTLTAGVNHLKLFMNRTGGDQKTNIWGYVTNAATSLPISGCPILDITGVMTPFSTTDPTGFYLKYVSPGTFTLVALPPTGYSLMNYDHATGVWGWGPWTGTVSPGESRHVDFVIKLDKESMVIAGQVVMAGTGDPVAGFDLETFGPSTPTLYATTPSTGFFIFSPLNGPGNWTLNGHHPSLFVSDVEHWLLMSGPHTNSPSLPITFGLTIPNVMWVKITVQKEVPNNATRIWGYVYTASIGGPVIPSCSILEMTGTAALFSITDTLGHYNEVVTPGAFTLMPLAVGGYSIQAYDWGTGGVTAAPWTGTVLPGESRHVDFIMKQTREAAIIAGQVVMNGTGDPVAGFNIGLSSGSLSYNSVTPSCGFFISPPIYLYSAWQVAGFGPNLTVVKVNYHLFPSGSVSTATSLPVSFTLSSSDVMWVEIVVDESQQEMAKIFGKVYKLFSYAPAIGATVRIYQMPGTVLIHTLTADSTGYYEKVLTPGDYYLKATLTGYGPSSASVVLLPGANVYQPFYLMPRIHPLPINITLKVVQKENGTPIKDLHVEVAGLAKGRTDAKGEVRFGLPEAGEYKISIPAAYALIYDLNGNELGSLDEPVKLEVNGTYLVKVSFYQRVEVTKAPRKAEGIGIPPLAGVGILLAALVVGAVVGYAVRRPKTHDIEE